MDTETAAVTGHDVTTIVCVCGNTVSQDGLIQANAQGVPVFAGDGARVPAELAPGPRMKTCTPCAPHAAACTATPSWRKQEPRPSLSKSASPLAQLPRQSASTGTSARKR